MSEAYWSFSSYDSNSTDGSNEIYFSDTGYGSSEEDENNPEVASIENEGPGGQLFQRNLAKMRKLADLALKKMEARRQKLLVVRLLAAKSLLATEVQLKAIQENLLNRVNRAPPLPDILRIGQVSISQIEFEYKNLLQMKCLRHFLVCTVTFGTKVFLSKIVEANSKGVVRFNINHTFCDLMPNFKIGVAVHCFTIPKQCFRQKVLRGFKKLCFWRPRPTSYFTLLQQHEINISHVNRKIELSQQIGDVGRCKLFANVDAEIDYSHFRVSGFLDVSENGIFWNERWCVLDGTELKFYYFSSDVTPLMTFNIRSCIDVSEANIFYASRDRTLMLKMYDPKIKFSRSFYYFLSAKSNSLFEQWKILQKVLRVIQAWKDSSVPNSKMIKKSS